MDKERRELNERMRIIAKRMDHIERAFRKAEIPLLADDYERQQTEDKSAFEASRQGTIDAARQAHQGKLDAKRRLSRVMLDYETYVDKLSEARGQDYSHRKAKATERILDEKVARRKAVLAERERAAKEKAEQERIRREREEQEEREQQGKFSSLGHLLWFLTVHIERLAEETRREEEAEAARRAEEEKKKAEEERTAAARRKREEEKAADMERIRKQQEREEEAERRRVQRSAAPPAAAPAEKTWRPRTAAVDTTPPASSRPSPQTPSRYVPLSQRTAEAATPSLARATGPGWRERERLKETSNSRPGTPGRQSPALPDDDGFQPVNRPRQAATGGAYRPPGARNR
jgi:translation initiation factor 3 subunit A